MTRRRPAHRLTSALIGAIITALGVLTMALLSGRDLDTELIAIVSLAAVGGWLLITALLAGRRPRSGQWAAQAEPSAYAGGQSTVSPGSNIEDDDEDDVLDTGFPPADSPSGDTPSGDVPSGDTPSGDEPPLTAAARRAATRAKAAEAQQKPSSDDSD